MRYNGAVLGRHLFHVRLAPNNGFTDRETQNFASGFDWLHALMLNIDLIQATPADLRNIIAEIFWCFDIFILASYEIVPIHSIVFHGLSFARSRPTVCVTRSGGIE